MRKMYQFNCDLNKLVQIPMHTILEVEANLLDPNVKELEFELKTVQVSFVSTYSISAVFTTKFT